MNDIGLHKINLDTPLRLGVAAKLAFPDGSISIGSLRGEIAAGRLKAHKIAGKHFVTMREIEEMRERCRVIPKARASSSKPQSTTHEGDASETQLGSSATGKGKSALVAALRIAKKLSES
jgi:hypothetical protein